MTESIGRQVYEIYIAARPEDIWWAITTPEFTRPYFYGPTIHVTAERHQCVGPDGSRTEATVMEFEPPRRLVHEWSTPWDPETVHEPASRVTWEITADAGGAGVCRLTVIHDRLEQSPNTAGVVKQGWMVVLSGLKTLLETGQLLARVSE